ncbi:MAG: hypothetical protein HKN20_10555 [Gemmatimonadetes bacterium]|nr:hypothetical protein [Gemmatimonadota bacterium]
MLNTSPRLVDGVVLVGIAAVILSACLPVLTSGQLVNLDNDFFLFASHHEHARQGLLEHGTILQRSHLVGGGYPIIGGPEDPTFNPLILLTLCLGTVMGIKWIGVLSMVFGATGLYVLARNFLGHTRWGAIASAIFFGLSLWIPVRMRDGNPNEVYYCFIPACLCCLLALPGRRRYLVILVALFMTMLSDGKLTFFASIMFLAFLCGFNLIPGISLYPASDARRFERVRPTVWLAVALGLTFLLYMFRILPAIEVINTQGSLARMSLFNHPGSSYFSIYPFSRLWQEAVAWNGEAGLDKLSSVCIGWVPLCLAAVAFAYDWRRSLPWAAAGFFFCWLAMAYSAPVDLFYPLSKLPILSAINNPGKYFAFLPVLCVCVLAGQSFDSLRRLPRSWMRHLVAILLIGSGGAFLYPKVVEVSRLTYTEPISAGDKEKVETFYQIRGDDLPRNRWDPYRASAYINLMRGIGTIDWYTAIPNAENAVPRYLVNAEGDYAANPDYRGECFWLGEGLVSSWEIEPHTIEVDGTTPGGGTLVINQNYHRDWRVDAGTLREWQGLLAVDLPAGTHHVTLRYSSRSLRTGLLISIGTLVCVRLVGWRYGRRAPVV